MEQELNERKEKANLRHLYARNEVVLHQVFLAIYSFLIFSFIVTFVSKF